MAWQQSDADAVRAAIVDLASGKRVVTVTYAGPPQRSVEYASAQLPELRSLLAEMDRQLKRTPTYSVVSFNKGFDPRNNNGGFG
jgi:hypothetical protein